MVSDMSDKAKKKKRNRTKDMLADYYRTNKAYDEENRRRQQEEGLTGRGLRDLNATEKILIVIIALGLIGIVIKYFVL